MHKIGKFLIWWVAYFPDQKFYLGKCLLYDDNRLFHGPCIDHLGSAVILTGWRDTILYYRKIHTKTWTAPTPKTTVEKESKTSPSCSLKSTMKQQKLEIKMERVVTYATYELISVFAFHFVFTIISLLHSEYSNDLIMAQLSSTLAAGIWCRGFSLSDQVKFKPDCSSTSWGFVYSNRRYI